jgi:hypothetical protein
VNFLILYLLAKMRPPGLARRHPYRFTESWQRPAAASSKAVLTANRRTAAQIASNDTEGFKP